MSTETVCRACSQEVAEYELIDVFGGSGFLATIFGQCMSLEVRYNPSGNRSTILFLLY